MEIKFSEVTHSREALEIDVMTADAARALQCYIHLPYSKFAPKKCCCSLAMVQINLYKFTFSGQSDLI